MPRPIVLLCNPDTARAEAHRAALTARGAAHELLSYRDLLADGSRLSNLPSRCMLRIESCGEDWHVEKQLLRAGWRGELVHWRALRFDRGRYRHQGALRRGTTALFGRIGEAMAGRPDILLLNDPQDILAMYDKQQCRERIASADVPVPPALHDVRTPEQLRAEMRASNWSQVFVKPRWGSSAAGVIAFRMSDTREKAITSLELVRVHGGFVLYNSLKVREYTASQDIDDLLRTVLVDGAVVERWIPKRAIAGKATDFRVLCFDGDPAHVAVRSSRSPITNLHLGNDRGDWAAFERLDPAAAQLVRDVARDAARCFESSLSAAVDVLLERDRQRAWVLEVNAFGELLHHTTHAGRSPHELYWDVALGRDDS